MSDREPKEGEVIRHHGRYARKIDLGPDHDVIIISETDPGDSFMCWMEVELADDCGKFSVPLAAPASFQMIMAFMEMNQSPEERVRCRTTIAEKRLREEDVISDRVADVADSVVEISQLFEEYGLSVATLDDEDVSTLSNRCAQLIQRLLRTVVAEEFYKERRER